MSEFKNEELVKYFTESFEESKKHGLSFEFISFFLDDLNLEEEQIIDAIHYARREWDF